MWEEELFPYSDFIINIDALKDTFYSEDIIRGLEAWQKMRKKRKNGVISDQDYIEWKLHFDLEKQLNRIEPPELRMERAKQSVRRLLDFNYNGINDKLIEEVVEKIIVHQGWFEWKLCFLPEPIKLKIIGKKKDYFIEEVK